MPAKVQLIAYANNWKPNVPMSIGDGSHAEFERRPHTKPLGIVGATAIKIGVNSDGAQTWIHYRYCGEPKSVILDKSNPGPHCIFAAALSSAGPMGTMRVTHISPDELDREISEASDPQPSLNAAEPVPTS